MRTYPWAKIKALRGVMRNEQPARVIPDTETGTEPIRRLEPDKVCDDQKGRIARRVIKDLP